MSFYILFCFFCCLKKKNSGENDEVRGECLEKKLFRLGCKFYKILILLYGSRCRNWQREDFFVLLFIGRAGISIFVFGKGYISRVG